MRAAAKASGVCSPLGDPRILGSAVRLAERRDLASSRVLLSPDLTWCAFCICEAPGSGFLGRETEVRCGQCLVALVRYMLDGWFVQAHPECPY